MKTILVTGGCGFILSNFIRHMLVKYPYKIINLDALTYAGRIENTQDFAGNKNYSFVRGDIRDKETVERLVQKTDYVVNGAAETHVDRSIVDAGTFVSTDVMGTYTLLEACRKYGVQRYLQVSTDEVYGSTDHGAFKETDNLQPNSPYSASKAGGDMLVRAYAVTHELPAVITRSSNNYGPYQYPEKIIPLFITNLLRGRKVPLYGDGHNVRDWLHVTDNCTGIEAVMHDGTDGEIYNIGGGTELANIELTKMILDVMGKDSTWIQHIEDRKGHDRRYALDISKIKKLGWAPQKSFSSGLRSTIEWYTNNESWWKPLVVA